MAYALLAGMPPIYGLYASLAPLVIYAIFATSTKLSVGPVAVSALLIMSGVSEIAIPQSPEFTGYVITAGLLIGLLQVALGILRLGFLVNLLSHPVIAGFTSAAAIIIIISQIPDALGLHMTHTHGTVDKVKGICIGIGSIHVKTAILCIGSLLLIILLKAWNRKIPGALIVVLLGIALSYFMGLHETGMSIVGSIPTGLPAIQLPELSWASITALAPTVLTVTLIGIVESIGIAKALQRKHKDHNLDPDQELVALGLAKVGGSLIQAIPTSASFSRSAINSNSGARTQVSTLVAVALVVFSLLFLTDLIFYLPKAVLSAIILLAVANLFDIKEMKYLWKSDRSDFWMMMATFVATLALGIEPGVLLGVVLSLLMVLYNASKPTIAELGKIEGTNFYKNVERFENADSHPDHLIFRFENQLFFANAEYFRSELMDRIEERDDNIKYVLIDSSIIHSIDSTGMHMLKDLDDELKARNIELHLCGTIGPVRDCLHLAGLLKEPDKHHLDVNNAVLTIQGKEPLSKSDLQDLPFQTNAK